MPKVIVQTIHDRWVARRRRPRGVYRRRLGQKRIAIGHSSSTAPASTNPLGGGSRTGLRRSFLNEHAPYRVISRGVVVDVDDLIDDGQAGETGREVTPSPNGHA